MNSYRVTMEATTTKTLYIDAKSKNEAIEKANEDFSTLDSGCDYAQDVIDIEKL